MFAFGLWHCSDIWHAQIELATVERKESSLDSSCADVERLHNDVYVFRWFRELSSQDERLSTQRKQLPQSVRRFRLYTNLSSKCI
jgi:hypothetical protein